MIDLFIVLLTFYLLILIGYIFGRIFRKYNEKVRKSLSYILLFILTPPLIFLAFLIPNESLNSSVILLVIIFELILVSSTQILAYILALRKRGVEQNQRTGSILSLVAFPNAFLFPLPIVLSLFGSGYIVIIVIFSLSSIFLRSTWSTYQSIYYGKGNLKTIKQSLKEMFLFPPTLALMISVILYIIGIRLEHEYFSIINTVLSRVTSILGGLFIGILLININFKNIHLYKTDFYIVCLIRVVFSFCLFFILWQILLLFLMINQIILVILLLLFVDPPAVSNITYSDYFELDRDFTAFCVFTITMLAVIYIPLIILFGLIIL